MDYDEYAHTEVVRARACDPAGEVVLTTTHGIQTVFGGYLVLSKGGGTSYVDADTFEARYAPVVKDQKPAESKKTK